MAQDKTKEISQMSYEEALAELEQLSSKMSQGGLTLERVCGDISERYRIRFSLSKNFWMRLRKNSEAGFRTDCNHFFRLKRRCAF